MTTWSQHFTKEGRAYYYNRDTKQSTWIKPDNYVSQYSTANPDSIAIDIEWEELFDPKNQRLYYYNRKLHKSQWQKPEDVNIQPYSKTYQGKHSINVKQEPGIADMESQNTSLRNSPKSDSQSTAKNGDQSRNASDPTSVPLKRKKNAEKSQESVKKRRYDEKPKIICDQAHENQVSEFKERDTEATRLLSKLAKPDAIMDTFVMSTINEFLRTYEDSDGPEILVEKLSSSYRGYAQMIGLVSSWMDSILTEKPNLESVQTAFRDGNMAVQGSKWLFAEDLSYEKVRELIVQHYNPKLLSNLLSASSAEPEWLTCMIQSKKWREMLIELSETHKSCNLLQYAIRRISEAGHHKEVASVATANAFFSVFNGVLMDSCCRLRFDTCAQTANTDSNALQKLCCQSEYSYIYAEELFCLLDNELFHKQKQSKDSIKHHIEHIRTKLHSMRSGIQIAAVQSVGSKVEYFHALRRQCVYKKCSSVCDAILSIIKTKKCSDDTVRVLALAYKSANPPPAAHLRHPLIFYSLLDPLFNPSTAATISQTKDCVFLLAYVASTKDSRSILQPFEKVSEDLSVITDKEEVENTASMLTEASIICISDKTLGYNMSQTGVVHRLVGLMHVPVVSMGVLHWLTMILSSNSFTNSTLLHICFPNLLQILKASIRTHPTQWSVAFDVLVTLLRLRTETNPVKALELKRESLRCMVFMITSGYVFPVIEFVYSNISDLDQALLRHFVTTLLAVVAPPFSKQFITVLMPFLVHTKVQIAVKSCSDESKTKLRMFLLECEKCELTLPEHWQAFAALRSALE